MPGQGDQRLEIIALRQLQPDEESPLGAVEAAAGRELLMQQFDHQIPLLAVAPADPLELLFVAPDGDEGIQSALDQARTGEVMQVHAGG